MSEDNEFNNLERRTSGIMLYISLLEIFTKFKIFKNPEKIIEVLCGTLEVFLKNTIKNTPEDKQTEFMSFIIKGFEELLFRLKEKV